MDSITKDTRVSDILDQYGDIAGVMDLFGVQPGGCYSTRRLAATALTVEWAARFHRAVPADSLAVMRNTEITRHHLDCHPRPRQRGLPRRDRGQRRDWRPSLRAGRLAVPAHQPNSPTAGAAPYQNL